MTYKINLSPEFQRDLDSIRDYIADELLNPEAAEDTVNGILEASEKLSRFPKSGRRIFLPGGLDSGYRCVMYNEYLAVYRIINQDVYVVRAVHRLQDYLRVLFPGGL